LSAAGLADTYLLVKALHIVSATILFGTGLGTAFFFWSSRHAGNEARLFAARTTVRADFLFTLPAVIVQPLTGVWMMERAGFRVDEPWIAISVALYILAGVCWLPVVGLQIRMKRMLEVQANGVSSTPRHSSTTAGLGSHSVGRLSSAWSWSSS
jgi:uncharacterized membrane protein